MFVETPSSPSTASIERLYIEEDCSDSQSRMTSGQNGRKRQPYTFCFETFETIETNLKRFETNAWFSDAWVSEVFIKIVSFVSIVSICFWIATPIARQQTFVLQIGQIAIDGGSGNTHNCPYFYSMGGRESFRHGIQEVQHLLFGAGDRSVAFGHKKAPPAFSR